MIAYLKGQIYHKSSFLKKDNFVVVSVGGVGYKVFILNREAEHFSVNEEVEFHVYTQVAEGVLDLYGFVSREELEFFEVLISISGIGPRSALGILQKAKLDDLKKAAQSGNAEVLNKISGIGPKTAQKIVIGLKDKLADSDGGGEWDARFGDALEALIGLGYSASQAREALNLCQSQEMTEKVKEALKILSQK
ncbi:MAG: Holliday junction branch migration protein RuvA [Patescibacteria group bacterium]